MKWIPGGEFTMGTDDPNSMPNERPAHRVRLDGYWINETPVTNAQFRKFIEATGYLTTAERPVDWERRILCHESCCESYRPVALRGTRPDMGSNIRAFGV